MKTITKCRQIILLLMMISLCFSTATLAGGLKERMKARQPAINKLKAAGIVGENNVGLLEFRTGDKSQSGTVNAENADRQKVYSAIGKQQNVSANFVSKKRAEQIAAKANSGTWVQDAGGSWHKK